MYFCETSGGVRYTSGMIISKRHLHHIGVVLQRVALWQLVVFFVVLCVWSAYMLRQNSLNMISLRDAVERADEQNNDIDNKLNDLRRYVATHMNTSLGDRGIYLEHSYQRAYDQAVQDAQQGADATVYQRADKECQGLFSRTASYQAYVQCVTDKAATNDGQDPVSSIKAPSADFFRYNFTPPRWSPDLAGWGVLVSALLGILIILRVFFVWLIHILLKRSSSVKQK